VRDELRLNARWKPSNSSSFNAVYDFAHRSARKLKKTSEWPLHPPAVRPFRRQHGDRLDELVGHTLLVETPQRFPAPSFVSVPTPDRHQVVSALHAAHRFYRGPW